MVRTKDFCARSLYAEIINIMTEVKSKLVFPLIILFHPSLPMQKSKLIFNTYEDDAAYRHDFQRSAR